MNATLPMLRDFSDRFSPIVVKELRQGLRTRFFTSALILFHTFIILLLITVTLGAPVEAVNGIFWGIAGFMLLAVMPLRGFAALHTEAADGTLDMLTLTSIASFRILYGKWVALYSQTLLVAGSILPYMVARYFFGGVEILQEVVALVILALGSGVITAALLSFSSQGPLLLRIFLALCVGAGAVPLGFFTAFLVSASQADSMVREFFALALWEQCSIIGGILALVVYAVYYFLALGSSRIAPPSENHSTLKRLIALAVHGALMVTGLLLCFLSTEPQIAMWAYIPLMVLTLIVCMDVLTEEMPRYPTAVAVLAQRGHLGRLAGRLFYPGWASGVLFSTLLCGMVLSIMAGITWKSASWDWDDGPFPHLICLFLAVFVPVILRINRTNTFVNWWVVQLCSVICGIMLLMFCFTMNARGLGVIGMFTPITTLFGVECVEHGSRGAVLFVGCVFSAGWLLAAMVRATTNFNTYTTLECEALEQIAQETPRTHDAA
jgi:predicted cobalt transporter CbtA